MAQVIQNIYFDNGGAATFAGNVTAAQITVPTYFNATSTSAVLGATGSGNIYLRPNGIGQSSGQLHIATSGLATFAGDVGIDGGNLGIGTTPTSRNLSVFRSTAGSVANFLHYTDSSNFSGLYIDVSDDDNLVTLNASGSHGATWEFQNGNTTNLTMNSVLATFSGTVTASSYFLGSSSEISLATTGAGTVFLRPNGQSTSGQMKVESTGNATFAGDVTIADNLKATGGNLKLWAGGTHVFNVDVNRNIYPQTHNSTDIGFSSTLAFRDVYLSGTIHSTGGANFSGSVHLDNDSSQLQLGDDNDMQIYHNGANGVVDNNTGDLIIRCDSDDIKILAEDDVVIRDNDDSTEMAKFINGGAVELYHNGSKKIATTSGGVDCSGYYGFTSTGNDYGFYYGVEPGATQGIAIKSSDTGGAYFDGLGYFWNSNTGDGAGMFQMQNDGNTYCRYLNFFRGGNDSSDIIGWIGYNATNTATTFSTSSSDERLKKNIVDWNESVLPKFLALEPKQFHFNKQDDSEEKNKGYIAQKEVDNFPEVYQLDGEDDDARYGFHPMEMTPYLMKAIKELVEKNKELENRLEALEN